MLGDNMLIAYSKRVVAVKYKFSYSGEFQRLNALAIAQEGVWYVSPMAITDGRSRECDAPPPLPLTDSGLAGESVNTSTGLKARTIICTPCQHLRAPNHVYSRFSASIQMNQHQTVMRRARGRGASLGREQSDRGSTVDLYISSPEPCPPPTA